MLRAAQASLGLLGDSSSLVSGFLHSQLNPEGGFCDRSGRGDLYYTVFGLESLIALSEPKPPEMISYLRDFGLGEKLDLVHLCCLIRCRAGAGVSASIADSEALLARLESYRTLDGGYNPEPGASMGSAYGCFLATMAYEDLEKPIPAKNEIVHCLKQLRAADGGFANHPNQPFGLTPSTAAVATLLQALGEEFPPGLDSWLLSRMYPEGGFYAVPAAPIPDLLSTATTLHALSRMEVPLDSLREPCLNFIHSLWTGGGAFAGSWADRTPDCEYTYYGLLALGHLIS
jgi:prenyltransferase beta subunit